MFFIGLTGGTPPAAGGVQGRSPAWGVIDQFLSKLHNTNQSLTFICPSGPSIKIKTTDPIIDLRSEDLLNFYQN